MDEDKRSAISRTTIASKSAYLNEDEADCRDKLDATVVGGPLSPSSHGGARLLMDWDDVVDRSGMAEMCQYVQHLEAESHDLQDQLHFHKEQDAKQLAAAASRIEMLQSSLQQALDASEPHREEKDVAVHQQSMERERIASLVALMEEAQKKYEDAERARQHAIFKLSALQASVAEADTHKILGTPSTTASTGGSTPLAISCDSDLSLSFGERMEKYKRGLELLRQTLELKDEQAHEKQRIAVGLALRSAHKEHTALMDKLRLECDLRLSEWRHAETVRAKETQAAMDEDRYSIRLKMRHALQRAQIEQCVSHLQAQAALSSSSSSLSLASNYNRYHHYGESDFSFGTLDEVFVRMQLKQLRARRLEALKKVLLIRQAKLLQMAKDLVCRWRIQTTHARIPKLNAVLHMHRVVSHLGLRTKRSFFNRWKAQTRLLRVHEYQNQALSCWNRMLAVERISHVIHQRTVKRVALFFHHWCLVVASSKMATLSGDEVASPASDDETDASSSSSVSATGSEVPTNDVQALQQEIKKLHDQLAASKSEAWRYKRQLLKQFL
ncbi:hypothetical protein FI667_g15141, partial [Globisporangium splendens]